MSLTFALRTQGVMPSAVREILKVAEQPDVLSFAGGLPAPELFPVGAIAEAHARVLAHDGPAALQYSTSEGFGPLREWVASDFRRRGVNASADSILITNGSQQGIDLAARVLLDPGAVVVTENPSYLAALQVFSAAQARVVPVESDHEGLRLDALARVLATENVRLVYVVPNFANPTGGTLSLARRQGLMALTQSYQVPVLEDDPYGALRFSLSPVPPLAAFDDAGLVLSMGTFSKTLAPGLRVGWVLAPPAVRRHLVVAKQACDLHTGTLTQRATADLLAHFDYEAHLSRLCQVYSQRCETMNDALGAFLPAGSTFTKPHGGLFFWVELPGDYDTTALLPRAVAQKLAYVPGAPFFATAPRANTLRLNFSNRSPELIREGMKRLGRVLEQAAHEPGALTAPTAANDHQRSIH